MPLDSKLSPRAAIRTWLSNTDDRADRTAGHGLSINITKVDARPYKTQRSAQSHRGSTTTGDNERKSSKHQGARTKHIECCSPRGRKSDGHETGLAERLGLHPPFRTFKEDSEELRYATAGEHYKAKRRRARSFSSPLQPAAVGTQLESDERSQDDLCGYREIGHNDDPREHGISQSSQGAKPVEHGAERTKSYEKRSRHKTREDKYDIKKEAKGPRKRQQKEGDGRKDRKRKRKEKTGNTLMHKFTAPNVAQNRLTMKPTISLGFFGKGRASSPVRRKGLPDLTFSEMSFLKSRREQPKATMERGAEKKKRQRKDKVADTEAEISRYFTSRVPRVHNDLKSSKDIEQGKALTTLEYQKRDARHLSRPQLPPLELPDRPFLGFGSPGASLTSPTKPDNYHESYSRDLRSPSENRSSTGSTMYHPWSQSERSTTRSRKALPSPQTRRSAPLCPVKSTSSVAAGSIVFGDDTNELSHGPYSKELQKRSGNIGRSEAIKNQRRSKHKVPEPRSQLADTAGNFDKLPSPHMNVGRSELQQSNRSPTKSIPEKPSARSKLPAELGQSTFKQDIYESDDPCKKSYLFDTALENVLDNCRRGPEPSRTPREMLDIIPVNLTAPADSSKKTYRSAWINNTPEVLKSDSGRALQAPRLSTSTYPQERSYAQMRRSGSTLPTHRATSQALHKLAGSPVSATWTTPFARSTESGTIYSGSAWNSYRNLYESQGGDLSIDTLAPNDEQHRINSWTREYMLETQASAEAIPYSRPPDSLQSFSAEHYGETVSQRDDYDVSIFPVMLGQPMPFHEYMPRLQRPGSPAHDETVLANNLVSHIDDHNSQVHQIASSMADPVPYSKNAEQHGTMSRNCSAGTREAFAAGGMVSSRFEDHNRNSYEDAYLQSSHMMQGRDDDHLSNFWKPNRLY